jgi:hypothetical protein
MIQSQSSFPPAPSWHFFIRLGGGDRLLDPVTAAQMLLICFHHRYDQLSSGVSPFEMAHGVGR